MIYLKKEDWSNLILSKLTNEESFKEEFKELWRIYNIINLLSRKIYQQINEQQIIFIAAQIFLIFSEDKSSFVKGTPREWAKICTNFVIYIKHKSSSLLKGIGCGNLL